MLTLKYYGQSAFRLQDEQHAVFIDPFLSGNPVCASKPEDVKRCDFILLTHGHADHLGDAIELAERHGATVVATYELAQWCASKGVQVHPMAPGGGYAFPFGRVKMVPAIHGCGCDPWKDGTTPPPNTPVGLVITWGKKIIYHAGDTALFSDMKLIGEQFTINVACLPIGDNFTMGVEDAGRAAEWLGAEAYVPMHYNTFEIIKADPLSFAYRVEKLGKKCKVMSPGTKIEI